MDQREKSKVTLSKATNISFGPLQWTWGKRASWECIRKKQGNYRNCVHVHVHVHVHRKKWSFTCSTESEPVDVVNVAKTVSGSSTVTWMHIFMQHVSCVVCVCVICDMCAHDVWYIIHSQLKWWVLSKDKKLANFCCKHSRRIHINLIHNDCAYCNQRNFSWFPRMHIYSWKFAHLFEPLLHSLYYICTCTHENLIHEFSKYSHKHEN